MKKPLAIMLGLALTSVMVPAAYASEPAASATTGIRINPIENISPDFIKGADVSMLKQIEVSGGRFYDGGVEKEALQILKDHGVNWVRLRIWNHPFDQDGKPLGGGNNDKAKTNEIAKRAHDLGLKVLLDFHYSDFWADPEKQNKPAEWAGLNTDQLQQALYDYTADVIQGMKAAGAMPEMVQIGNETNTGMVWPDGQTTGIGGYDGWANLVKQGVQAVRDNDPNALDATKRTKIMIHLADGGNSELYRRNFDQLQARNVDYDVIGFSYYPYWHGPLDQLKSNMEDISKRYNKEVLVAENAYAYTLDDGDNFSNNFGPGQEKLGGYKATVQGQAQEVRDVMNAVAHLDGNKGLGVFYWEPDWIPVKGAEWSSRPGEGNGWENQAMFDFNGNALPSLDVFSRVSASANGAPFVAEAAAIHPVEVNVTVGGTLLLPAKVKVDYTDDSVREMPVVWEEPTADALTHPGTLALQGTVAGVSLKATGTITVQGATNFVKNPGFESGDGSNWTITGDSSAVKVVSDSANAHASSYALHYSLPQAMPFLAEQRITGLANGTYTLKVWSHGGGGENSLKLFAKNYGGEEVTADIRNTKWLEWKHPIVVDIKVTNHEATIGVEADGNAGNWGNIDDFEFYTDNSAETLVAPVSVRKGAPFTVSIGNSGLVDTIYAEDVTVNYDASKFAYVAAQPAVDNVLVLRADHSVPGIVRLVVAHRGGKQLNTKSLNVTFKSTTAADAAQGTIAIGKASWGTAPGGAVIAPASLGSATIAFTSESSGNGESGSGSEAGSGTGTNTGADSGTDNGTGTGTGGSTGSGNGNGTGSNSSSSSSSGSDASPATPYTAIQVGSDGAASIVRTPTLDANQTAAASLSAETWKQLIEQAKANSEGEKKIVLQIAKAEGASAYELLMPKEAQQSAQENSRIEIVTPLGNVSLPSQTWSAGGLKDKDGISLFIGTVDPATVPASLKAKIGDKPIIDLHFKSGGQTIPWNNPHVPVTVSIPYTPSAEELRDPDHIVVWYLDGSGDAVAVPNAKYDSGTNRIVFTTTHFSTYAAAFVKHSFSDLTAYEWARKAVEVLASKGVTDGTSPDTFSPELQVSRADFAVMLVKALGLTADKTVSNFDDVQSTDYYNEALGILKGLGITDGVGENRFDPKASIAREDLMVLTARALQISKKLRLPNDSSTLNAFKDHASISAYAAPSVAALVTRGIVGGNPDGISPRESTTRAEAAVIIYRVLHEEEEVSR
ncbi:glycosyl hydrolase 53 family protein [Paenibacillus sp. SI8]|uniref:glycosyl hydrolase 53 family protein n=1 Tax=unclassified Paenibacillus TaxID=185978 RepID=UPI00346731EF